MMRREKMQLGFLCLCLLVMAGLCLPVNPTRTKREGDSDQAGKRERPKFPDIPDDIRKIRELRDLPGLDKEEYKRYWDEAVKDNPNLRDRLKQFNPEDIARLRPNLGDRMARSSEDIRNRLDEARRMNVDEMRQLEKLKMLRENNFGPDVDWEARREAIREKMPGRFSNDDLQKRLEDQRRVLEELDQKRKEEFKRYEMEIEHKRKVKLKAMDEKNRLKAEEEFQRARDKLQHHEKMKHPASREQFEDVWEGDDGMADEEFDPKTFFHLHDTNGDKMLDPMELEALFYKEVRKVYGKDEIVEAREEMARMREHVMTEMDADKDGIVSFGEFMGYTAQKEKFETDEGWKAVVDEGIFSDKEMEEFEDSYDDDYYQYDYGDDMKTKFGEHEQQSEGTEQGKVEEVEEEPTETLKEEEEQGKEEEGEEPNLTDQEEINVQAVRGDERPEGHAQQFEKNP